MCPGDLASANGIAAITRPPKNKEIKEKIIVMTSFLTVMLSR